MQFEDKLIDFEYQERIMECLWNMDEESGFILDYFDKYDQNKAKASEYVGRMQHSIKFISEILKEERRNALDKFFEYTEEIKQQEAQ